MEHSSILSPKFTPGEIVIRREENGEDLIGTVVKIDPKAPDWVILSLIRPYATYTVGMKWNATSLHQFELYEPLITDTEIIL